MIHRACVSDNEAPWKGWRETHRQEKREIARYRERWRERERGSEGELNGFGHGCPCGWCGGQTWARQTRKTDGRTRRQHARTITTHVAHDEERPAAPAPAPAPAPAAPAPAAPAPTPALAPQAAPDAAAAARQRHRHQQQLQQRQPCRSYLRLLADDAGDDHEGWVAHFLRQETNDGRRHWCYTTVRAKHK